MRKVLLYILALLLLVWSNNAQAMQNVASPKGRVVVIDAGHGGPIRPGAVVDGVMEKELNLNVSLLVEKQLKKRMPNLEVYLTRSSDKHLHSDKVSDNLQRPKIANEKCADLFVAIHANAAGESSIVGAEVIVLSLDGATQGHTQRRTTVSADNEDYTHIDNIDKTSIAYIEALSMLMNNDPINRTFGEIVGAKFKSIGRRFRGVKVYPEKVWTVLYPLRGPGVIIEMGFMTNPSELKYMASASGQEAMAKAISDAIIEYFELLEQMTVKEVGNEHAEVSSTDTTNDECEPQDQGIAIDEGYTIQLMANSTQVAITEKRFGELSDNVIEFVGNGPYKYKYCYGRFATLGQAKSMIEQVRKVFAQAYIVQYRGNNIK